MGAAVGLPRDARVRRRHDLQGAVPQRAVREAVRRAAIAKHVTCHTCTTMIYTHVLNRRTRRLSGRPPQHNNDPLTAFPTDQQAISVG
jgi:hypothetical protein